MTRMGSSNSCFGRLSFTPWLMRQPPTEPLAQRDAAHAPPAPKALAPHARGINPVTKLVVLVAKLHFRDETHLLEILYRCLSAERPLLRSCQ